MGQTSLLTFDLHLRLRELREQAGMSQVQAAKRLGVSERTFQAWEAGTAFPQMRYRAPLETFMRELSDEVAA